MKKNLTLTLICSALAACTTTETIFIEPTPYTFQKSVPIPPVMIRVYGADYGLYTLYIEKMREQLEFHNLQIDEYNDSFIKEEFDANAPDF